MGYLELSRLRRRTIWSYLDLAGQAREIKRERKIKRIIFLPPGSRRMQA